jgi:hypothetical protein
MMSKLVDGGAILVGTELPEDDGGLVYDMIVVLLMVPAAVRCSVYLAVVSR